MPTISSKISKKEHDVIISYANACGETMSNLIRKVLIKDATFYNGFGGTGGGVGGTRFAGDGGCCGLGATGGGCVCVLRDCSGGILPGRAADFS